MKKLIAILGIFVLVIQISVAQNEELKVNIKKKKYGYVNTKGKVVIKRQFTYAEPFSEDLAVVESSLKFGYINKKGEVKIPLQFYDAGLFSEGYAYVAKDRKYGYINKYGDLKIEYKYKSASEFKAGLAIVGIINPDTIKYGASDQIYGIIDINNNVIGDKWFSSVSRISIDSFKVTINKTEYTIGKSGELKEFIYEKSSEVDQSGESAIVEEIPEFKGGMEGLMRYLQNNMNYPKSALENNIEGKVFVKFEVTNIGTIENVGIQKSLTPLLDKEAMRVVREMPVWKPGKQRGKTVRVNFILPIIFRLT